MLKHNQIATCILPGKVLAQIDRESKLIYLKEQVKPILIDLFIQSN